MNKFSICYVKLPKAGLANKLLVWAQGVVFAERNNAILYSKGWVHFSIGPILRHEKSWRIYYGYFNRLSIVELIKVRYSLFIYPKQEVVPSDCDMTFDCKGIVSVISTNPHWREYFQHIQLYRVQIVEKFNQSISGTIQKRIASYSDIPWIGVHIRMGDFKIPKNNDEFCRMGQVRTPISHFTDKINQIRKIANCQLPVLVFSDGTRDELGEILNLSEVALAENDLDIIHLVRLSQSKILIMSAGSTFSMWAAFMSNAIVIHHPAHYHYQIRDNHINSKQFEGTLSENTSDFPELFLDNLRSIASEFEQSNLNNL